MNRNLGAVYTPDVLADWVAIELAARMPHCSDVFVVDPACGDGALLRSMARALSNNRATFAGIDVDRAALNVAARNAPQRTQFLQADALSPAGNSIRSEVLWKKYIGNKRITAVISNPPWGADLRQTPTQLRQAGFNLAQGQFDSYDLFVEMSLRAVPEGAKLAFILPDSLFQPEHKPLRTLLLQNTRLHMIARLGEGFFKGVFRATAVVVCEKRKPHPTHSIECFRLQKAHRKQILANCSSLQAAKIKYAHFIRQGDFLADLEKRFTIDVRGEDLSFFQKIHRFRSDWASWLVSGRGVELSKTGSIVVCPKCSVARPEPRPSVNVICENCGGKIDLEKIRRRRIVKKSVDVPLGWKRLIVGEDVDRYQCQPSRIIEANVEGINYKKPSDFQGIRLLVRKTGVGIKAAIDNSGSFTNQVVFHYKARVGKAPDFFLNYVLGVLCSRAMLAYHLKRTGDNEWRSHPYMTQKTIAELPIPVPSEGTPQWRQAKAIARAVSSRNKDSRNDIAYDYRIESLVAGLYGLDEEGCAWVTRVLDEAQALQAIASLRTSPDQIRPLIV